MAKPMYDSKSYELAEYFLKEEPDLDDLQRREQLAIWIQQAVESWFTYIRDEFLAREAEQEENAD